MWSRSLGNKMLARPGFWVCAGIFLYAFLSLSACKRRTSDAVSSSIDSLPYTSITRAVETLISDSGITKYKLEAPVWYTYQMPENYWYFPEGLYVEQFDTLFAIEASIKADTAYYHQDRKLWELIGNVEVLNREGKQFFGNSLYWDESAGEVYSHEKTLIVPEDGQLIESEYGFRSNQSMTRYELYSSHGHVDVEDKPIAPADSAVVNDEATAPAPPRAPRNLAKQPLQKADPKSKERGMDKPVKMDRLDTLEQRLR